MEAIDVCLAAPPGVNQLGLNLHGRVAEQRFRMRAVYGLHLYHYHGSLEIDGRRHDFAPGSISFTPPNADLAWRFPRHAAHHYAHLRLGAAAGQPLVAIPLLTPGGDPARQEALRQGFESVIANHRAQPGRSAAWIWSLLWSLVPVAAAPTRHTCAVAGGTARPGEPLHPAMQTVLSCIEDGLDGTLALDALAKQACLSKTHLIRLFHRHCGTTVMGWIRRRRMERAHQLLTGSSMPIHAVAAAVGLPDLQHFNKLVRGHWGSSPNRVRGSAPRSVAT